METVPGTERFVIDLPGLATLVDEIRGAGYRVTGPRVRDDAFCYEELGPADRLPEGFGDEQGSARYRLTRGPGQAIFRQAVGPHSWKRFLSPPEQRLFGTRPAERGTFRVEVPEPDRSPWAFVGVRPCDLAAIRLRDRVLLGGPWEDRPYREAREGSLVVVVHCTAPAGTCFCASMGTGPAAREGYDLGLTELDGETPLFVVEAATSKGGDLLSRVEARRPAPGELEAAAAALSRAAASMGRTLETDGLRELLEASADSPRWEEIADRCLACGNCTMACPTCFCTTVDDTSDLSGSVSERWRRWDSCFTLAFSYIHGGSVRRSVSARYRQWMTHKLGTWHDQFGTSGCVGCGRCITWCPAGIDITEEAGALRRGSLPAPQARS
jgi:ferredoxin